MAWPVAAFQPQLRARAAVAPSRPRSKTLAPMRAASSGLPSVDARVDIDELEAEVTPSIARTEARHRSRRDPSLRPLTTTGKGSQGAGSAEVCADRRGRMRAGTPTAMEFEGTSQRTTALAPMATLSPMRMEPRSLAPAPMSTRLPMTGEPRCPVARRPMVTPLRMRQSSPRTASPLMTMPPK